MNPKYQLVLFTAAFVAFALAALGERVPSVRASRVNFLALGAALFTLVYAIVAFKAAFTIDLL